MKNRHCSLFLVAIVAFAMNANAQDEIGKAVPIATADKIPSPDGDQTDLPEGTLRPLTVTLDLLSGTKLEGTLLNMSEIKMKTSFGEAVMPLNEVAGIRLAEAGNGTTTIILHNGDSVTGGTELQQVDIITEWGRAEVNGSTILSILFTQGVKWESDPGFTGARWKLVEDTSAKISTATSAKATTSKTSSSSTYRPSSSSSTTNRRTVFGR